MNPFLLTSTVVGASNANASSAGTTATGANPMIIIALYVIIIGGFFFFTSRNRKKREAEQQKLKDGIQPGDWVLLDTGIFGKVADITAECYIVEFGMNKGVRIPVLKQSVYGKREPNLTNKAIEEPEPEKRSLFGGKKKDEGFLEEEKKSEEKEEKVELEKTEK